MYGFTAQSFRKFSKCREEWLNLSRSGGELAVVAEQSLELCSEEGAVFTEFQFHKYCYRQFTNVDKIQRAQKRKLKNPDLPGNSASTSVEQKPQVKRSLRSAEKSATESRRRSKHVLPENCIICLKANKRKKDPVSIGIILLKVWN